MLRLNLLQSFTSETISFTDDFVAGLGCTASLTAVSTRNLSGVFTGCFNGDFTEDLTGCFTGDFTG